MVTNTPTRLPLLHTCGTGAGEVTRDITAFVKEKQIMGKTFLRLNDGDLEGYVFFSLVLLSLFFVFVSNNWIESKV
jgi:hypothetical protein